MFVLGPLQPLNLLDSGAFPIFGYHFGVPNNNDRSICGLHWGPPMYEIYQIHTYAQIHIYAHMHIHLYIFADSVDIYACTYIYTHMHKAQAAVCMCMAVCALLLILLTGG